MEFYLTLTILYTCQRYYVLRLLFCGANKVFSIDITWKMILTMLNLILLNKTGRVYDILIYTAHTRRTLP